MLGLKTGTVPDQWSGKTSPMSSSSSGVGACSGRSGAGPSAPVAEGWAGSAWCGTVAGDSGSPKSSFMSSAFAMASSRSLNSESVLPSTLLLSGGECRPVVGLEEGFEGLEGLESGSTTAIVEGSSPFPAWYAS